MKIDPAPIAKGLKMSLTTWIFLIVVAAVVYGFASSQFDSKPAPVGYQYAKQSAVPELRALTARELQWQRVNADAAGKADLERLQPMEQQKFCATELPKIRTAKLKSEQIEARMYVAAGYGAMQPEQEHIQSKTVFVGMSACGAMASWGRPEGVNTTQTAGGDHTQWVYGFRGYLYFRSGKLTAIQTSK